MKEDVVNGVNGVDLQCVSLPEMVSIVAEFPFLLFLPYNTIRDLERRLFPEWFDVCHLPVQPKPAWLQKLWENCLDNQ